EAPSDRTSPLLSPCRIIETTGVPELPDVEHFRRVFGRLATGKTVASVWADPTIVRNAEPAGLARALTGHRFDEPRRHGKWLICSTDGPVLLLHFGMTGDL